MQIISTIRSSGRPSFVRGIQDHLAGPSQIIGRFWSLELAKHQLYFCYRVQSGTYITVSNGLKVAARNK